MFTKTGETEGQGSGTSERSRLAQDLRITGNLKSAGTIEVLGEVQGDIDAGKLMIGAGGRVNGKVRAEIVEVLGRLDGSASCKSFTMRSTAQAKAQVTYENVVIENGAQIDGKFKHAKS